MRKHARLHDLWRVILRIIGIVLIDLQDLWKRRLGQKCSANPVFDRPAIDLWGVNLLDLNLTFTDGCKSLRVLVDPEESATRSVLRVNACFKGHDVILECGFGLSWLLSTRTTNGKKKQSECTLMKKGKQGIR